MNGIIYRQQLKKLPEIFKDQSIGIVFGLFLASFLVYEVIQSYMIKRQLTKRCGALFPVTAATAIQLMYGSLTEMIKSNVKMPEIYLGSANRFVKGDIYLKSDSAQEKSLWSVFVAIEILASVLEGWTGSAVWRFREFILYDLQRIFFRVAGALISILVLLSLTGSISWNLSILSIKAFVPVVDVILIVQHLIIMAKRVILHDRIFTMNDYALRSGIADENDIALIEKAERRRISL